MPKKYERSIRYNTTKEVDGYVFHLHCVQLAPNEGVTIEEVFIGDSTHNAVDFIDPKLVLMWERELDTEMPEIRAEIREDSAAEPAGA